MASPGDTGQINDERREKGSRDQKGDRRDRGDRGKGWKIKRRPQRVEGIWRDENQGGKGRGRPEDGETEGRQEREETGTQSRSM